MTGIMADEDPEKAQARHRMFYRLGRAAGKQFRKGGAGRQVARRVGGSVLKRGLLKFLR